MNIGIPPAPGASIGYYQALAIDQRRPGANIDQLRTHWRQLIAANLKMIALEPTKSLILYSMAAVFKKNYYKK